MSAVENQPLPSVVPMLSYEDVGGAADWLTEAFGFHETGRWFDETGTPIHINMAASGGVVMLGSPSPDYQSPKHHAETCKQARTWANTPFIVDGVLVYVRDIGEHQQRTVAAGAKILSPLEDNEQLGQRHYRAEDLEGHRWMFAEPL